MRGKFLLPPISRKFHPTSRIQQPIVLLWSEEGRFLGSRIMHYCITSLTGESLGITDGSFFLGGLAPDLHSYMGPSNYYRTHFSFRNDEGLTETDYDLFERKYFVDDVSPFHLGYYFHIISDDIWKHKIYYRKIKGLEPHKKEVALKKNYRDFWRLNGKIIDHHSLVLQELAPIAVEMDEIDHQHFPKLIQELYRDFKLKDEASNEDLEILDLTEVLSVIESSVRSCLGAYRRLTGEVSIGE